MKTIAQILFLLLITSCSLEKDAKEESVWIISAPSGDELTKIDKKGKTVIPNGRYITPAGKSILTAPHPYGLALSPDGNVAVTHATGAKITQDRCQCHRDSEQK